MELLLIVVKKKKTAVIGHRTKVFGVELLVNAFLVLLLLLWKILASLLHLVTGKDTEFADLAHVEAREDEEDSTLSLQLGYSLIEV